MKPEKKGSAKRQQHHASPSAAQTTSTGTPELPASSNASVQQQMPNAEKKALQQQQTQKQMFNELAVRNNFQVLEQSRTCQAAVSGIASGILGLTGTMGFVFYFLCLFIQAFIWDYKAGFQWKNFFPSRWLLVTHSLVGGLFTYVLFWVFVYGLVHVY